VPPGVLLLHGQPGSGDDWAGVRALLPERVAVVAPDRPGYHDNPRAAGGFAYNAVQALEELDRADVEQAVVAGYSWGGAVASELALHAPGRVRGLVLAASVGPGGITMLDRVLEHSVAGPLLIRAGLQVARFGSGLAAWRGQVDPAPFLRLTSVDRLVQSIFVEQRALRRDLPGLEARLGAISVPTVVVFGDRDRTVRPSVAHALAAAIPEARLQPVPGAGHLLPYTAPEAIATAIMSVLASTPR
jgi:pimeloyl-ACP methyl ester carboxylesterase